MFFFFFFLTFLASSKKVYKASLNQICMVYVGEWYMKL